MAEVPRESADEMQAELDRLKQENERLRAHAETPGAEHRSHRTGWGIVLAVIAALLLALAVPAIWVNRYVLDTDGWVHTVAPLAEEPAIQDYVAGASSEALITRIDTEQRLTELLPDQLDRFAPVLAQSVDSAIRTQATELVRSPAFASLWVDVNRAGHQALLSAITGRSGVVSVEAGTFTLDVGKLVDELTTRLEDRGLGFVSRIPTGAAAGRQITLYQSDVIAQAGPIIDTASRLALWIPLLALAVAAGAFAVATDRRRVALWLGVSIVIAGLLPLQAIYFAQFPAANGLEQAASIPSAAGQAAYDILFRDLVAAERFIVVLGVIVWLGAIVAGPARWAVAMRAGARGGLANMGAGLELGTFGTFVHDHTQALRVVGIVLAVIVLLALPAPRTIGQLALLVIGVLVWFAAIEVVGGSVTDENAVRPPRRHLMRPHT